MTSIFLSHSHRDKDFVNKLAADLRQHNITVWVDDAEIIVGDSLFDRIARGITTTDHFGVVISKTSTQSGWVKKETEMALALEMRSRRVRVLPLLIDDVEMPLFLLPRAYADFRQPSMYDASLTSVLKRLSATGISATMPHNVEPEMVFIPAGEFLMGSDPATDPDAESDEYPQHMLELSAYYLGRTPVTMREYWEFVDATERNPPRGWPSLASGPSNPAEVFRCGVPLIEDILDRPVNWVTWFDAAAYCQWLSKVTGDLYRLPSDAEWEKGARGRDGRIYPWGNEWDAQRCQADRSAALEPMVMGDLVVGGTVVSVNTYRRGESPYGLRHMAGNVQEWTRTLWQKPNGEVYGYPYNPADGREGIGLATTLPRSVRGGSFLHKPRGVRCAFRNGRDPASPAAYGGFRVLREPKTGA